MDKLLPAEITLEIFSRLSVESVLECRLVCKTWLTLLRDPSFGHMHLRRQLLQLDDHKYYSHSNAAAVKVSFIFLIRYEEENYNELYYSEYDENDEESYKTPKIPYEEKNDNQLYYREYGEHDEESYKTLKTVNHPPFSMHHSVVGSCNGLICFCVRYTYEIKDPVYICNPITREYVNLPRLIYNDNEYNVIRMMCGFGYHPSIGGYKVVRIYYCRDQLFGRVQVYTLGSRGNGSNDRTGPPGMWRNKGEISYLLRSSYRCVLANGDLHWLDMEGKIVAFDLEGEDFHLLPSPLYFLPDVHDDYELHVFEGWLCVVHCKRDENIDMVI
ncbi:F-box domain [Macleaya cordata]|uniref:F-box domain n=1 Tax=Macleaya cordata TaxID=56857 RepID=A0A200QNC2_MACCD|nr:F-box domain [Macleaya cordata]